MPARQHSDASSVTLFPRTLPDHRRAPTPMRLRKPKTWVSREPSCLIVFPKQSECASPLFLQRSIPCSCRAKPWLNGFNSLSRHINLFFLDQKKRHDPASLAIAAKNIHPLMMKTLGLEAIGQTRQTGQRSRPTNIWQPTTWSAGLGVPHSGILGPSNHIFVASES